MNVLEAYDFIICSICCGNSSDSFLNIFDNFIGYNSRFFSLAEIVKESLNLEVSQMVKLNFSDTCDSSKMLTGNYF